MGTFMTNRCTAESRHGAFRTISKGGVLTLLSALAFAAGGLGFGAGPASASAGADCLWAGEAHPQGAGVVAGGRAYNCGLDVLGYPRWYPGQSAGRNSTVDNPGARGNPTGRFSAGARQPGTDYNDYCVGSQLIEGSEDIYEAVADSRGVLYWRAAGAISHWAFDPGTGPQPSWRSSSLCYDGMLI
ncbi:hypothetical protein [Nocardia sp. NPDC050710]|uniref:hypothetical protein n=1 Tax=Nocardia sp. NPDC050710 TaxID=3157220 RepID=UPI0033E5579C